MQPEDLIDAVQYVSADSLCPVATIHCFMATGFDVPQCAACLAFLERQTDSAG